MANSTNQEASHDLLRVYKEAVYQYDRIDKGLSKVQNKLLDIYRDSKLISVLAEEIWDKASEQFEESKSYADGLYINMNPHKFAGLQSEEIESEREKCKQLIDFCSKTNSITREAYREIERLPYKYYYLMSKVDFANKETPLMTDGMTVLLNDTTANVNNMITFKHYKNLNVSEMQRVASETQSIVDNYVRVSKEFKEWLSKYYDVSIYSEDTATTREIALNAVNKVEVLLDSANSINKKIQDTVANIIVEYKENILHSYYDLIRRMPNSELNEVETIYREFQSQVNSIHDNELVVLLHETKEKLDKI